VAPSLCVFGKIFSFWLKTVLRGLGTWGLVWDRKRVRTWG
jgi:hypothetical protein